MKHRKYGTDKYRSFTIEEETDILVALEVLKQTIEKNLQNTEDWLKKLAPDAVTNRDEAKKMIYYWERKIRDLEKIREEW